MKIVNLLLLQKFSQKHSVTKKSLEVWRKTTHAAEWVKSQDVIASFPTAKIVKNSRARFTIVGGSYRLVAEIDYEDKVVDIRFIGTHAEYDKIDATTI